MFLCNINNCITTKKNVNLFIQKNFCGNKLLSLVNIGLIFNVINIKYSWEVHTLRYIFHALSDYYDSKLFRVLKAITKKTIIGRIPIYLTAFDVMTVYAFKDRDIWLYKTQYI